MSVPILTPDERTALSRGWLRGMVRATGLRPDDAPRPTVEERLTHAEQRLAVLERRLHALEEQWDG